MAAGPPVRRVTVGEWLRENLFSTWYNTLLTLLFIPLAGWVVYRVILFVFVDGRWEIIDRNLSLFLIAGFPAEQQWRLWAAAFLLAATFGIAAGVAGAVRRAEAAEGRAREETGRILWRRVGPGLLLLAVLFWFGGTLRAAGLIAGAVAVWAAARWAGRYVPLRFARWSIPGVIAAVGLAVLIVTGFGGVGWNKWGGLLLTVWLTVGGIALSFPIGVLLALGRRSSMPAVRAVCVAYIELIRGVPLITMLFMGMFVIGFVLPPGTPVPGLVPRALIAIVIFTSAYVAEIVRGGIQSIPQGQFEAAQALGLSTYKTMRLIVLPQALRSVIPAMVGQFISLFKDTSLVAVIGLTDLLRIATTVTKQGDFVAQGLYLETLIFVSVIYWVGCYSMSRESQRLERRLGVGER